MAGEKNAPAAPAQSGKKSVIVFSIVALILLSAIILIWVKQTKSANATNAALSALQQDVTRLRQETDAKDRVVTDLITKIEASITSINVGLQTLAETSTKQQGELATLRKDVTAIQIKVRTAPPEPATTGKDPSKEELATMSQPELLAQLSALGDRIERLKNDVVLKETKILQTQITDAKGRLDKAEKDVSALTKTVDAADLPSMKAKVQEIDREVSQAEIEVKTLSKAHAEFKQQISGFFGEVFYNDPWGKYAPQEAAKGK